MLDMYRRSFGVTPDGDDVYLYTLTGGPDFQVEITNFGGCVVALRAPDQEGNVADVVLGFEKLKSYLGKHPYFGAIVGRYANRIAQGTFTLEDRIYTLAQNDGPNHLHGGVYGFDRAVWKPKALRRDDAVGLRLLLVSPDGDEGYPGTLACGVTYWVTENRTLEIEYEAQTDAPTHVNLTNHSFFNLAGHEARTITDHQLTIFAEQFVPINDALIPTGELQAVEDTPFDFREPRLIGERIEEEHEQLFFGIGYDHTFAIDPDDNGELRQAVHVSEPTTGRVMEVWTTEPGVQFYSGNFLDGTNVGKDGKIYKHRRGFCLETQHFPDSPNQPNFPSTVLRPDETYRSQTEYRFSTV